MSLVKKDRNGNSLRSMFNDLIDSNSFFGSDLSHFRNLFSANLPAANVKETETQFEIELAVPGFSKADLKIDIEDEVLRISAEKKEERNEEKENFTRREFNYNSFERSFSLPQSVDQNGIRAEYKEGLLLLIVPKREVSQKKTKKEITVG